MSERITSMDQSCIGRRVLVFGDDGQARLPGIVSDVDSADGTVTLERPAGYAGPTLVLRGGSDGHWYVSRWRGDENPPSSQPRFVLFWSV